MSAPRIALIGARRVRQGLGPFVAAQLRRAGATIAGVLGTSDARAREAAHALAGAADPDPPRAYTDLRRLIEREAPHAVAILSPHATHEPYLEQALDAKLHVLCEKPFIYGGQNLSARAARLVEAFDRAQLLLRENCQWPEVLSSYYELFPESAGAVAERFSMHLCPVAERPSGMLADSLSHPLSVIQALRPDPEARIGEVRFRYTGPTETSGAAVAAARLDVGFRYEAIPAPLHVEVALRTCATVPRPAGLALDGHWAQREIREPDYSIHLTAGGRSVKVPDPLGVLVGRFVAELRAVLSGRRPEPAKDVAQRMRLFESVQNALRDSGIDPDIDSALGAA